ncbi:phosphatidate cytidylyltransferase [Denitromonas ohlonensis]|uniref:Phosphatidate cytidylyltransferase n=2 Tax=Denitromonas TaxID=139331 RepID=A0A558ELI1_9RHOO|nr:phosphatidate cytidylyltransferase [Denitromonas ohlonensis]TVT48510.1 MAG: phosphatidate cytidylyltransferase [Denitromonas halophila]TVO69520.1 phosphatidate cytidylyltransferase [Denitromonas ohlonensis]TVO77620.1 phosphatidate cytidylyltransferase [Denitromonas ohlonensis]TVT73090.1 MAG: phosphatidate cytidylyltransferase [Denitromonas halophila]TVT74201.1 MAG: phosphatidate cytidylyltransferase [Denitromonas halophila]
MLKARILTAIVMLAVLSVALTSFSTQAWIVFVAVIAALAGWEWGGLAGWSSTPRIAYGAGLGALLVLVSVISDLWAGALSAPALLPFLLISIVFWVTLAFPWLLRRWTLGRGLGAFVLGFVVVLPTALAMIILREVNVALLLAAMAVVWVADIAAYFSGRAFGRRKLAPAISPGKSWEGVYGAIVGVELYGLALVFAFDFELSVGLIILGALALVVLTAVSVVGDLFESLLKRQAGIKDSSGLLPGHGGVLDRIDSLTSTLPMVACAVLLLSV